jgi:MFS family permease
MPMLTIKLGGGAALLGLLFGSFGVGGMAGAVGSVLVRGRVGAEAVVLMGTTAIALASLALGLSDSVAMAVGAHFLAGAGWVSGLSTFNVSIQLAVPRRLVGRVLAMYQTTAFGGLALGSALWGFAADGVGIGTALSGAGCFTIAGGLVGARFRLPLAAELQDDSWISSKPAPPIASS